MNMTPEDIVGKVEQYADLKHAKRNSSFIRQVALACSSPGTPATQAAGKAAEKTPLVDAISMYRFMGNEEIPLSELRSTRAKVVFDSVPKGSDLLVIHDMSPLDYSRHNSKCDRRPIGNHKGMGYEYVSCVAVDPTTSTTLGVIHDTVINDDGPDDQDIMNYDYEPLFADFSDEEKKRLSENHRHQMAVHINGTASLLADWHVIDVGDREFDDIFILDRCQQNNRDFVIRSLGNRNVQIPQYDWVPNTAITQKQSGHPLKEGYVYVNFKRVVEHVPMQPYKTLPLDTRNRVVDDCNAKRWAHLSIGAFSIRLYRDAQRNGKYFRISRPVEVNVVVIRELDPPADCKPLCWILLTSLPIGNYEQIAYVGRIYELRWKIESFFRLLKSGYRLLDSRLNNARKIARNLVVITLAAMTILHLKQKIGLPSKGDLDDENYQLVKTAMLEPNNTEIDLNLRLFSFIAKNGGWLGRRRDPIGPTVLMRGMLYLLAVLDAFKRYGSLIEEALQNPQVLRRLFCV